MSELTEIELTFLAKKLPNEIKNIVPEYMEDFYIPENSKFPVLRLRNKNKKYEITKKTPVRPGDYSEHTEHTILLTETEFLSLTKASNRKVSKKRFKTKINGYTADVDVFVGDLKGLVLIDFEFINNKEKENFILPSCCLVDVTQERTILGGQLAGKKYEDISDWLDGMNYKKVL